MKAFDVRIAITQYETVRVYANSIGHVHSFFYDRFERGDYDDQIEFSEEVVEIQRVEEVQEVSR